MESIREHSKSILLGITIFILVILFSVFLFKRFPVTSFFTNHSESEELYIVLTKEETTIKKGSYFSASLYVYDYSRKAELILPSLDTSIEGVYTLQYEVTDSKDSVYAELIVHVVANLAPTLELNSHSIEAENIEEIVIKDYIVIAVDEDGNNLEPIITLLKVEESNYIYKISITDRNGLSTSQSFTITVMKKEVEETTTPSNSTSSDNDDSPSNNQNAQNDDFTNEIVDTENEAVFRFSTYGTAEAAQNACLAAGDQTKRSYSCYPIDENEITIGFQLIYR